MLSKVLKLNYLVATPAFLGAALLVSSSAYAAESQAGADALLNTASAASTTLQIDATAPIAAAPTAEASVTETPVAEVAPVAETPVAEVAPAEPLQIAQAAPVAASAETSVASLDEIVQYGNEVSTTQAQVTSISQLSDVQPTDWAFQALQSLVERYGCIAGYPDGTYRGQRALTRFEFAAGLNACLDRISELIASSTADLATKEDLATLRRLQDEFQAELSTLRGRVDALESRTSELEANQFSTTTKLNGEVIFAAAVPIDYDDEEFDDQANAGYRVRLNFDTSFTGEDLLRTRLQARDFSSYDSLQAGLGDLNWSFGSGTEGEDNDIVLNQLFYQFPLGDRLTVLLGANATSDSDYVTSTISPFDSSGSGSLTNFGAPRQYALVTGGTGLGLFFELSENLSLDLSYAADEAEDSESGAGLFNGDGSFMGQLTFLSDFVDLGLMYANTYLGEGFGFLNADRPEVANVYGAQVNFKFGDFELGGGVAYAPIRAINRGDYDVWSYQGTLAIRDLGGRGNLLGILAGAPLYAGGFGDGTFGTLSDVRNQDTPFAVEGFYRFRLNSNIAITPGIVWLTNPGNDDDNSDSIAGVVRTTFTF
ncbi:iron uptake porin [Leptolyngbya sp. FACHB-711]|uniref:iron uptake porin n=1 Tax=unclassified Leptolyngbya TaxID=2650499 RepID=UPI0016888408|nr:iron uptake porin [Leptolyngbya sp. FACHB-711]MBD1849522.1 carbohydrate porin [Cyanobacteria bacterium FACHB-502]MBD2026477.1 carbohydrate porin [Leptolyngbya sp. FACHB-711]